MLRLLDGSDSEPDPVRSPGAITVVPEVSSSRSLQQLLIVPDGALHQLPFESLLMPTAADELMSQYVLDVLPPIRYGPSLSVLATIERSQPQEGMELPSVLTVGDPQYPPPDRQHTLPSWNELFSQVSTLIEFTPLHYTGEECDAVYASFAEAAWNRTKLLQADATEANVRSQIELCRVVHIAAHGFVDHGEDNLIGALVLSPNEHLDASEDDGLLQLREIYTLDFSHCDLAVLSACETYVGADRPLEAGMSMARAFLEQGAQRVVCSHWNVDDEASAKLIKYFFQFIHAAEKNDQEMDYAAALYAAKKALRGDPRWRNNPKYWSPFVLVGAP
jgi:CHAT domain-containing protein